MRVSPVIYHTERAAHLSRNSGCIATRRLAVLRNPQEGGWPGDNLLQGVEQQPVPLSQEAGKP